MQEMKMEDSWKSKKASFATLQWTSLKNKGNLATNTR